MIRNIEAITAATQCISAIFMDNECMIHTNMEQLIFSLGYQQILNHGHENDSYNDQRAVAELGCLIQMVAGLNITDLDLIQRIRLQNQILTVMQYLDIPGLVLGKIPEDKTHKAFVLRTAA